jgi:protoporphyrinogen oxidase
MKKVIIIGAGPAGLTAAYKILKSNKNFEVKIFEESNEIGGISKTINYKDNRIDIGGHRFFTKDEEVQSFWNEIMPIQGFLAKDDKIIDKSKKLPKTGIDPEKKDNVFLIRRRVSRIYYLKKFFDYPVSFSWQTIKNMGFSRTIKCGFSYMKSIIIKKQETNLENFYINRFGKKLYSMFFEKYTEKVWGRSPKYIAADWGSQRVKGISILELLKNKISKNKSKETSLIEQFYYPKYGPGEFYEELAQRVTKMGGIIIKKAEVTKINLKDNKVIGIEFLRNSKQEKMPCDILISSMPLKDLINGMNNIPKNITNIANGLPYRDFISVGLLVNNMNIKNETKLKTINNIIPDTWIYVQEEEVKLGRIQIFNNWSPYMVKDDKKIWLGLEYCCNENDSFWNKSDEYIKKYAINELVKMNIINKQNVLDGCVIRVKKAYPAYFDEYKNINILKDYLYKINNLYCIGRNGQHHYNNMDHSIKTGIIAANQIVNNIKDDNILWNVNTEKAYHEVKNEN